MLVGIGMAAVLGQCTWVRRRQNPGEQLKFKKLSLHLAPPSGVGGPAFVRDGTQANGVVQSRKFKIKEYRQWIQDTNNADIDW